jgi:hypothetical protein
VEAEGAVGRLEAAGVELAGAGLCCAIALEATLSVRKTASRMGNNVLPRRVPGKTFSARKRPERLALAAFPFGAKSSLSGRTLELTRFAGLHVVPTATQILQHTGALHFLLEGTKRRINAVAILEMNFDHRMTPWVFT